MKNRERDRLQLLRRRSFSEVFDDLGRFVRTRSGPFIKAFALIPGPFILVTGLVSAYLGVLSPAGMGALHSPLPFIVLILLSLTSGLLLVATVVAFMRETELYGNELSVVSIRQRIFGKIGSLLTCFIAWIGVAFAISFAFGFAIGFLAVPLGSVHPELLPFLFFLLFLFVYPPLIHLAIASFFGMLRHDLLFGKAFSKAWDSLLINFWRNWSVTLVGSILTFALIMACAVPEGIFVGIYNYLTLDPAYEGVSGYIAKGLGLFRYVATNLMWAFYLVLQGLNYYSLHEVQSGERLLQRFERIAGEKG